MRKADLINGVEQLSRALRESGLELPLVEVARLGYRREPVPGELLTRLLSALRDYGLQAHRYTRPARLLADQLGLAPLEHADTWSLLIAAENRAQEAFAYAERVRFATQYLPRVTELLSQAGIPSVDAARRGGAPHTGADVLTVQVIESPRRFSTPTRLATLLDSADFESIARFSELSAALEARLGRGVHDIDDALQRFDFNRAGEALRSLRVPVA